MIRKASTAWRSSNAAAQTGCSLDRHIRPTPPVVPGIAEIGASVGALIREGRPLHDVLTGLCRFFDASLKGCFSSVLLLDRGGARVQNAVGCGLPAGYMKQLVGRRVKWIETPIGAKTNKTPVIVLDSVSDAVELSPILSLTGEPLGIFAVHRRDGSAEASRWYSALIPQFTHAAAATIERLRSDETLRRSAAVLERTQRLSSTCCFSWRVATDEISWSKELCKLFELDGNDVPMTLEPISVRVHPEDLPSFHEMIEQARRRVSEIEFECRLLLPDNSIKYLRVVAHQSGDQPGQLEYIVVVQDETHRRQTEEALAKLRAELVRTARVTSLGVLTAAIAHEVNQPLAGIVTNASTCRRMLAVDPPDVEGARETARRTIRDAERASEIIRRLRALFYKKGATCESLDLNEAAREVIALSLSELERNKVTVRTDLAGELPPVLGDRVQLQQVILNLFLNASDAMSGVDDRPRQLVIRTERDEADRLQLSVRDTGVGFEPQEVDRLFDEFYTTKSDGMGIGLSVSRSIIESHKGRLWATPNDGPGATFSFSIPCGPQDATSAARTVGRHMKSRWL
jgi:signal transduction histidine kinase